METFLGYLVGLVVGLILGLLGGGGSLLVVAIVYLLQKEPIGLATAYITLLVGISALFGFIPRVREKQIDWSTLLWLGIPVSAGMLLVRLWLIAIVPDELFVLGAITITTAQQS